MFRKVKDIVASSEHKVLSALANLTERVSNTNSPDVTSISSENQTRQNEAEKQESNFPSTSDATSSEIEIMKAFKIVIDPVQSRHWGNIS